MNKLRDCAMVLGLAGMLVMVAVNTKDVEATGKISYGKMERRQEELVTARNVLAEYTDMQLYVYQWKKENQERAVLEETLEAEPPEEPNEAQDWPENVTEGDYRTLLKLVEAEASGEDIKGKILVANVVLNRVENEAFPDSIEEVIYQRTGGRAQFSPVATGKIENVCVSEETVEAVRRALSGEDESQGALYFASRSYADRNHMRWFDENLTFLFSYQGHEFFA